MQEGANTECTNYGEMIGPKIFVGELLQEEKMIPHDSDLVVGDRDHHTPLEHPGLGSKFFARRKNNRITRKH